MWETIEDRASLIVRMEIICYLSNRDMTFSDLWPTYCCHFVYAVDTQSVSDN